MTFVLNDRVKQNISNTGTGTLVLGGSPSGFVSFEYGIGEGNSTYYAIENLPNWEVGVGTYSNGTLTRDVVLNSSNNGSRINISPGATPAVVFCNYPASKSVALDDGGNITSFDDSYSGVKFPDGTIQETAASNIRSSRAYRNIEASSTLNNTDDLVFIDTSNGNVEVILPAASDMAGQTITLKFTGGAGRVIVSPQGGDKLDSTTSFVMDYINQSISVFSNQSGWHIV